MHLTSQLEQQEVNNIQQDNDFLDLWYLLLKEFEPSRVVE